MDDFVRAYIEALIWSECGDDDEPLDKNYDQSDLAPEAMEAIQEDCRDFYEANFELIQSSECSRSPEYSVEEMAGHDFCLTRNGHGAGFWDGDWSKGDELTKASKPYGTQNLYVGDDGLLYV